MTNDGICVSCGMPLATESGSMLCNKCMDIEPSFNTIKATVVLGRVSEVKDFVSLVSKCGGDVVAKSGNFAVNAKSELALFSLDLSRPLKVEFYGFIPYVVREEMKKFIID